VGGEIGVIFDELFKPKRRRKDKDRLEFERYSQGKVGTLRGDVGVLCAAKGMGEWW